MKKLLFLVSLISISVQLLFAQTPQKMSYQAVLRNSSNNLITSAAIGMRVSILQGSATGSSVYTETQTTTTNTNGLASIAIGTGTIVSGNFSTIDWSTGPYFIKTETDPSGGTAYSITSTTQLMSVPYALYAEKSGTPGTPGPIGLTGAPGAPGIQGIQGVPGLLPNGAYTGEMRYWNGSAWVAVAQGTNGQNLTLCNGIPTWGSCPATAPALTTANAVASSPYIASTGGTITSDGGAAITMEGVCWSTSSGPTITDNKTTDGTGTGAFTSSMTGLTIGTTYYIRAYATNSIGTVYGNEVIYNNSNIAIVKNFNLSYDGTFINIDWTSTAEVTLDHYFVECKTPNSTAYTIVVNNIAAQGPVIYPTVQDVPSVSGSFSYRLLAHFTDNTEQILSEMQIVIP
ncbi:MAG TPA: collagen-like protein [Cytophagaceae bacterium]|jgi:hypothetical protein|nr:collagen-like protein [Cytophagaceae bacterium]